MEKDGWIPHAAEGVCMIQIPVAQLEFMDGGITLWIHYQNVTGKTVDKEKQGNFFTCSC